MTLEHFMPRSLPPTLKALEELALDLRWSWNVQSKALWRCIDADLWEATGNPVLILDTVSRARLDALSQDETFLRLLESVKTARNSYLEAPTWFADQGDAGKVTNIAYFSMEFCLSKALPIYSGGLGVLAGDLIKTASDMGLPMVGVGLLYQQGYFRQSLDAQGRQLAFFPFNDPLWLPLSPTITSEGEWLRIMLDLPGRRMTLRVWQAQVGRVALYLLDSNDPWNDPRDRGITAELYGGGPELRIQQELVLGLGGWRLLQALGLECDVCHLNEGHAAFAVLERARTYGDAHGVDFATALCCTRVGNVFTTHTPVPDGFDKFDAALVRQYLGDYVAELGMEFSEFMALGRARPEDETEPFNMAWLAMRGSGAINGVSRLHREVSRRIFAPLYPRIPLPEIPIGHVTNGVHVPTWSSRAADQLWQKSCGEDRWRGDLSGLEENFRQLPDEALWGLRSAARSRLVHWLRQRHQHQLMARGATRRQWERQADILDPDILTIGFARRFVAYKRPNLLLEEPARLERLLTDPHRPIQLVIAGKAHPQDGQGQQMIQDWLGFLNRPEIRTRAIFVEDYDMGVASELVHGVDLWLNTPLRPWEASGTSGMKVLVNGGLNFSELDGWWAEAYCAEVGWALGSGHEHPISPEWNRSDADTLYRILENEVIPDFYLRDERGMPQAWLALMRESMARLTGSFSSNRMLRQYAERFYFQSGAAYRERHAHGAALARDISLWLARVQHQWNQVRIGLVRRETRDGLHDISAQIYLDGLTPEDVRLELFANPAVPEEAPEHVPMTLASPLLGTQGAYLYRAALPARRPAADYTVRLQPHHPNARLPLELPLTCWEQ
ncbi:MAG: alpha-glucan family phosphorylase [Betaproteobacteria bacterium]|nr:alpha-glucan family phosphorylase [Betaproteobacteria bacterium]